MERHFDLLEKLEKLTKESDIKPLLKEGLKNPKFVELMDICFNPFRKFGVSKKSIDEALLKIPQLEIKLSITPFETLVGLLERNIISGNNAINKLAETLSLYDIVERKWLTKILEKRLGCNFSTKTLNSVGYNIPVFEVMLATNSRDMKNLDTFIEQCGYVSPKLDGVRTVAMFENGRVKLYSRNGIEFTNAPTIVDELQKYYEIFDGYMLDGEQIAIRNGKMDFDAVMENAHADVRATNTATLQYHVFDVVPIKEFKENNFTKTKVERAETLICLMSSGLIKSDILRVVVQHFVSKLEHLKEYYEEFLNQGYEGAMFIPKNQKYVIGRKANTIIKFKPEYTEDVKIVGYEEGTHLFQGVLGALKIEYKGTISKVGIGFSEAQREEFWNKRDSLVGEIIEIKYQEITKDNAFRFPVFKRFRSLSGKKV